MSHVATVAPVIKNLDALERACEELGLVLKRGQRTHKWYGTWVQDYNAEDAAYRHGIRPEDYGKCEHAIGVKDNPDAYEIGLVPNPQGEGYKMAFDFWAGGRGLIDKIGGKNAEALCQEYGVQVALQEVQHLAEEGWQISQVKQPNGDVQVIATSPGQW
jgi:hypothetical protein